MISACSRETLGSPRCTSTPLPRPIVVTCSRSGTTAPVSSMRMKGPSKTVPPVYPSSHRCLSVQLPSRERVVPCLGDAVSLATSRPAGGGWQEPTEVHCRASHREEHEMADKPSKGLADVVAASTALSDIDGQAGRPDAKS